MKEIELGKSLAGNPHINVVKFIGCVTTQSKNPHSLHFSTRYIVFFDFLFHITYYSDNGIFTDLDCLFTVHPIMIMEYMPYGDLLGYLRKSRGIHDQYHRGEGEAFELQPYDLVVFAKHIATGMVYLGSRGVCEQL